MRVVLAEDSVLLREGIVRVLREARMDVVAAVADADELLGAVEAEDPDAAVIDIRMPPTYTDEGIRAAESILASGRSTGVLVLSQALEPGLAVRLLAAGRGGVGYLLKDRVADVDDLADAIRRVARGGTVLDPEVVAVLVDRRRTHDPLSALTVREREVLALMAEGRSNLAIATSLVVTEKTVETHVANIFSKLGLQPAPDDHRRVLAVLTWLRRA